MVPLSSQAVPRVVSRDEYVERLEQLRQRSLPAIHSGGTPYDPWAGCVSAGVAVQPLAHVPTNAPSFGTGLLAADDPAKAAFKGQRKVKDNFVNRAVDKCGPAVVRVETEQKVDVPSIDNSDIFSFFFGIKPESTRQERRVMGHGSGFCIDGAAGVILTNSHVVQGADRITVSFAGRGSPLECEVLETDEVIDLAAIRVKERQKTPLPAMSLGTSDSVRTGDWAIVLGNPLGLQNTCTLGIVSSLDRSTGETGFDWMRHPLLQTDAAVNQGNSGGPMINEVGEVIGMISMRALFGEGIGFAIPIDSIRSAVPSLLSNKKVPRSYIGLKMTASSGGSKQRSGNGAFVEMVLPKSPAEAVGFKVDDEILELNGTKVKHFDEVQAVVRNAQVGARLTFKVKRGGHTLQLVAQAANIRELRDGAEADRGHRQAPRHHRVVIVP